MSRELLLLVDALSREKNVQREIVFTALEMALASATKKKINDEADVRVEINRETGDFEAYRRWLVMPDELVENDEQQIGIIDAREQIPDVAVDDYIEETLEPVDFGRIGAQAAKQVIMQKIREAERASIVSEFGAREGDVVTGHVQRFERGNLFIDLGRATAILPYDEQIPGERYRQGERVRALLLRVDEGVRGTFIVLSRSHPKFLVKLFETEVPEMAQGVVEVKSVVREPGSRAKIAVHSTDDHVDPVGALVGQRGVRVAVVTSELGGEKIDVVEWSENPADFVKEALKPAQIAAIELVEEENRAIAQVADDQQSLAIGRGGQNVRLAARLTGWKIDVRPIGGSDETEEESAFETTKRDIAGDDSAEADTGEDNLDPVAQDRDIASEAVEEQQSEPVEGEVDAE